MSQPSAKDKAPEQRHDVLKGDHLFVNHPRHGAMSVRVTATGRHGFTARCGKGEKHQLRWDTVLAHKSRALQSYDVLERGADGAIVADPKGQRSFVAGDV
ncbi:MAG: hypothetical protein E7K72_27540, partial [Roseomonas mucosa]|nr:hypothetical protein [Roseomonas mucosa]